MNLSVNKMTHFSISFFSLIIRFSITKSFVVYYFKAVSWRLIHRFFHIIPTFFIAAISRIRSTKKWTSRKYVSLPMCSIAVSFLTNLSSYIRSKKLRSLEFHLGCSSLLLLLLWELSTEPDFSKRSKEPCWFEKFHNNSCNAIHCCWKKFVFYHDWSSDVITGSIESL